MRFYFVLILCLIICTVKAQQEQTFVVKKGATSAGNDSLFFAYTPVTQGEFRMNGQIIRRFIEVEVTDSMFAYLLFKPAKTVTVFFSNLHPNQQNTDSIKGLIRGNFRYKTNGDTIRFSYATIRTSDSVEYKGVVYVLCIKKNDKMQVTFTLKLADRLRTLSRVFKYYKPL